MFSDIGGRVVEGVDVLRGCERMFDDEDAFEGGDEADEGN